MIIENEDIVGHSVSCTVHFLDGKTEQRRFVNTDMHKGLKLKGSKTKFYPLSSRVFSNIAKVVLHNPPKKQSIVETIRKNGERFLELLDNRLWQDLRQKVEIILANLDKDFQEWEKIEGDKESFSWWFWNKYQEEWLYHSKPFITVNTVFGKRFNTGPEVSKDIERYLAGEKSGFNMARIAKTSDNMGEYLSYHNRHGYDNSIEVSGEKGKAWLSREYRGCGNGHYYLLLSPTHAVFYEDD